MKLKPLGEATKVVLSAWWGSAAGPSTPGEMEIDPGSWTPLLMMSFYQDSLVSLD